MAKEAECNEPADGSTGVITILSKAWLAEIATSLPQLPSLRAQGEAQAT
jgi:hypothetical protein